MGDAKVKVLVGSDFGVYPSSYIRLINPLFEAGIPYRFKDSRAIAASDLAEADVLVLQRCVSNTAVLLSLDALSRGKPVIYELDDWLLDLEKDSYVQLAAEERANFVQLLKLATAVVCSTSRLLDKVAEFTDRGRVIENRVKPIGLFGRRDEALRLFVVNTDYFKWQNGQDAFCRALANTLQSFPSATVTFWGGQPAGLKKLQRRFPRRINVIGGGVHAYAEYIQRLAVHRPTVMLVPLEDTPTHSCKSIVKYLDAASLGIPCICSNVAPYKEALAHGETALLADNTEQGWTAELQRLLADVGMIDRMAVKCFEDVQRHHSIDVSAAEWKALLAAVLGQAVDEEGVEALRAYCARRMNSDFDPYVNFTVGNVLRHRLWRYLIRRPSDKLVDSPDGRVFAVYQGIYRHVSNAETMKYYFRNKPLFGMGWLERLLMVTGRSLFR